MTETSYTAWDDKLYQWPPPDGWYEAGDGKWWPEGYGPGPAAPEGAADQTVAPSVEDDPAIDAGRGLDPGFGSAAGDANDALSGTAGDRFGAGTTSSAPGQGFSDVADRADGLIGSASEAVSGAAGHASAAGSDLVPDALADAAPESLSDVLPSSASDAMSGLGSSLGSSEPLDAGDLAPSGFDADPQAGFGDVAEVAGDLAGDVDRPGTDDVGAALAETMGPRSGGLADPASSGISGFADAGDDAADRVSTGAADAAAAASEFFTADIPAADLGPSTDRPAADLESSFDRPVTDLDALPPPSFDPPGAGPSDAAADLGALAELTDDRAERSLFSSSDPAPIASPSFDGDAIVPGTDTGFEPAVDETLPPVTSNPGQIADPAAGSLGLPSAGSAPGPTGSADLAPGFGTPDETIVAPLAGAGIGQTEGFADPAETGQFEAARVEGTDWASPVDEPFNAPPPQGDGPGAMPWGQSPTPGGPPVAAGLDQMAVPNDRSGSTKTLALVGVGVAALVLLGVAAYLLFGGGSDDDPGAAALATGPGSSTEPHARTTPVEIFYPAGDAEQRFVVEVLEPVRDASGQTDGDPPADGQLFAVTRVRVANQSAADASVSDLRFNAVTGAGTLIERESNSCTTTEPALDFAAVLGQAGVAEGVVCWVVPVGDFSGLLLGIESTEVGGRIHINLQ